MKETIFEIYNPQNEFFLLTKDARRITHIALSSFILPVLFYVIAGVLTQNVFAPLYFGDPHQASSTAREAFGLYALFGTVTALVFLWVRFYEGRPFHTIGFTKKGAAVKYLFGFMTGMIMVVVIVGTMAVFNSIEIDVENINPTGISAIGGVIIFLFAYIIQGASEEIVSRGWMFQVIGARYKPWLSVVITSILFAFLHMGNSGVNPLGVINLLLISVLFTLFVMKDGSLWGACALHSAWNWTLGNVFGLSVSGSSEKVTVFDLNTTGNGLISGGDFGPEGSLITTVVLLIAILLIVVLIKGNK